MHILPDTNGLRWPEGRPITDPRRRRAVSGPYGVVSLRQAYIEALGELDVETAQLSLDQGGVVRPGVACYFTVRNVDYAICCDVYDKQSANLAALIAELVRLRRLRRYDMDRYQDEMSRISIPRATSASDWARFFGFDRIPTREDFERAYKRKAFEHHPDRGGDPARMREINERAEQARKHYDRKKR